MWYFLGVRLFKGELLAVKVKSNFEKKNGGEGGVTKKSHGHNFDFSGVKRIAGAVHHMSYLGYSFHARKIKIVTVSFFATPPLTHFFF